MVKRFIAGAVCPACGAHDSLQLEYDAADASTKTQHCVDCGYSSVLDQGAMQTPQVGTRVEAAPRADDRQVIKILPPTS